MKTSDFDFPLPDHLIAKQPAPQRDDSRLLVIDGKNAIRHGGFGDLADFLNPGDMLLLNNTRVLPVRLEGKKPSGGRLEILLVKPLDNARTHWEILSKGGYSGDVEFCEGFSARITGGGLAELKYEGDLGKMLWDVGSMPLPPYIKRKPDDSDKERYQTVYADMDGSIAAPTAGLHFTDRLLGKIEKKGVLIRRLTLHVGIGTFMPIRAEDLNDHRMADEHFSVDKGILDDITRIKKSKSGRIFAVGTTTTRVVEAVMSDKYAPDAGTNGTRISGTTDIFIRPGHEFKAIDCLITNFHLPKSTPLMLASAFCGRERLMCAYKEAIGLSYRFFSYGDAMLILRNNYKGSTEF